ncbi:MAG: hypothetical protein GEV09_21860 [Pseudonocardiaceae bacterium]|nr:hypothetical protein [Pseudonocardiaceae bacterium]
MGAYECSFGPSWSELAGFLDGLDTDGSASHVTGADPLLLVNPVDDLITGYNQALKVNEQSRRPLRAGTVNTRSRALTSRPGWPS